MPVATAARTRLAIYTYTLLYNTQMYKGGWLVPCAGLSHVCWQAAAAPSVHVSSRLLPQTLEMAKQTGYAKADSKT